MFDLHLFSGNNFNKRLGHGDGPNLSAPKRVDALQGEHVIMSVTWMYEHQNLYEVVSFRGGITIFL